MKKKKEERKTKYVHCLIIANLPLVLFMELAQCSQVFLDSNVLHILFGELCMNQTIDLECKPIEIVTRSLTKVHPKVILQALGAKGYNEPKFREYSVGKGKVEEPRFH